MDMYKITAHIDSLGGQMDEATIVKKIGEDKYIVDYKGIKCHAIFNWFTCQYYVDDRYGRVR